MTRENQLPSFSMRVPKQSRIWDVPAVYIAISLIMAAVLPFLDRYFSIEHRIFSPDIALTVLSTISGGMISFTGIVFSMIFVMVQFSSSSYSPRLAPFYLQDNVIKHSLGMFTATFLFTLTSIASTSLFRNASIPDITVMIAVGAVIFSAALFVALIQRVSVLQITSVLYMITRFGRREILENYPVILSDRKETKEPQEYHVLPPLLKDIYFRGISATLQEVDISQLERLAKRSNLVVEVLYAAGDTIPEGAAVIHLFGGGDATPDKAYLKALRFGEQRTIDQDPKYALRLLVDIAIRALSPAINDPTTAVMSLDRLEDLLRLLVTREMVKEHFYDEQNTLRVVCQSPEWSDFLGLAVDEIRFYGANSIQISRRLLALLNDLEKIAPESRKPSIQEHIRRTETSIHHSFSSKADREEATRLDRQGIGLTRTLDDDVFH